MAEKLVVVGGSVATTALIERLRELAYSDPIVVIDSDPDAPYDRPPLSKRYLLGDDADAIAVDWSDLNADVVRAEAVGVDLTARLVLILRAGDGMPHHVPYDRLIIATGAHPARLPIEPPDTIVLRSADDARRLRRLSVAARNIVIIGAGAIGVELASSLIRTGSHVTLLDRAPGPLERLLGGHLATEITEWLVEEGVDCRWGAELRAITRVDAGWQVEVADSPSLNADLLISAVGSRPAVAWLGDSELLTDGALLVDEVGRVTSGDAPLDTIFAIGDVASRRAGDRVVRTESWTAAREQGARLAEYLMGTDHEPVGAPYFWTEVAGRMVQVVGDLAAGSDITLQFEDPARRALLYRLDHATGTAWVGVNVQPRIARLRLGA